MCWAWSWSSWSPTGPAGALYKAVSRSKKRTRPRLCRSSFPEKIRPLENRLSSQCDPIFKYGLQRWTSLTGSIYTDAHRSNRIRSSHAVLCISHSSDVCFLSFRRHPIRNAYLVNIVYRADIKNFIFIFLGIAAASCASKQCERRFHYRGVRRWTPPVFEFRSRSTPSKLGSADNHLWWSRPSPTWPNARPTSTRR